MGINYHTLPSGKTQVDITYTIPGETVSRRYRKVPEGPATERELKRWAELALVALLAGKTPGEEEKAGVPTLAQFWPRYITDFVKANRQKHSTLVTKEGIYKLHLGPALGAKALDEIGAADVQMLKGRLARLSPKRVNNVLATLSSVLRVAAKFGVIRTAMEVELVKETKKEPEFYEPEELERLVVAARKVSTAAELVVLLGADCGLRSGEMLALEWSDVDMKARKIRVERSTWRGQVAVPKGGKSRTVPMTERLGVVFLQEAPHGILKGERVLGGVSPRTLRSWLARAQKLAGIIAKGGRERDAGKVHILRHTYGARLAAAGVNPTEIRDLMGHANLSTTEIYMHLFKGAKEEAVKRMEAHGNPHGSKWEQGVRETTEDLVRQVGKRRAGR